MKKKGNLFTRIKNYLTEIKGELKKVTWPTKGDMYKTSIAVVVSSVIFGVYLYLIDALFGLIIQKVMNVF